MTDSLNTDMPFEEALAQLEGIVKQLEENDVPLEQALQKYQQGIELSNLCQKKLQAAEQTVAKVIDANGQEEDLPLEGQGSVQSKEDKHDI